MIQSRYYLPLILLLLFAIGCGHSEAPKDELSLKKEELQSLQTQVMDINQRILLLESEIEVLDPENANKVRTIPVEVMQLAPKTLKHFVRIQGKVEANNNVLVSPKVPGIINSLSIREGQQISKGQELAQIDDAVLKRNIEEVNTQLDLATILYDKQKRLWDKEIGTEVQLLTANNQKESLERRLATMQQQLDMYKVIAPISGTVEEVFPKVGENAAPGAPICRVVNFSDLSLKAELAESYIPFIKKNDKVIVEFPTIDKNLNAKVSVVGQSIDPQNRTFTVEVRLPNDRMIKPNMIGELSINDRTAIDVITVPISLVQKSELGNFVFLAVKDENGQWLAKRQMVTKGLNGQDYVEILEGLKAGDTLITVGAVNLSDGQAITVENGKGSAT